ncbi:hypothetical protein HDU97_008575 [Phlyctochytrium planicorne]|nr:hypothetical protein HDU97_008575 [Phlyctochytrium planicorne]
MTSTAIGKAPILDDEFLEFEDGTAVDVDVDVDVDEDVDVDVDVGKLTVVVINGIDVVAEVGSPSLVVIDEISSLSILVAVTTGRIPIEVAVASGRLVVKPSRIPQKYLKIRAQKFVCVRHRVL